jgi:hypothetical protein
MLAIARQQPAYMSRNNKGIVGGGVFYVVCPKQASHHQVMT